MECVERFIGQTGRGDVGLEVDGGGQAGAQGLFEGLVASEILRFEADGVGFGAGTDGNEADRAMLIGQLRGARRHTERDDEHEGE